MFLLKLISSSILVLLISACGGSTGFPPVVTAVKVQTLQYGKTASIYIGGKDLRSSVTVDTNGACTQPSFASNSSTEVLILNCKVGQVGDWPLVLKSAEGTVIHTGTLSVPTPQVMLFTSAGNITVDLNPSVAPITVANFIDYVSSGYYRSTLFHRVIPGFMIQGGGYTTGLVKKAGQFAPIVLESNKGLSNSRGTISMARTSVANSATSEFFINLVDNTFLDYKNEGSPGYAVFGNVVQGLDVVDAIATKVTGSLNGFADVPLEDISITLVLQTK
jgi:cyclophilin family peptidyl-prolyl cis-trans isomerase